MADEITIRTAKRADADVLAGIAAVVQDLHFAGRPDVFKAPNVKELAEWFRSALARPRSRVLLAEVLGAGAGYAVVVDATRDESAFAHQRRWREVDQLAVLPSHRHRGVARALIANMAASARADGFLALELNTWAFNEAARSTYRRLGFIERNVRYELVVDPNAAVPHRA